MNVNGVHVAHIAWTFGLNGIPQPPDEPWAVNVFDPRVPTVAGRLTTPPRPAAQGRMSSS
jgi:poly-gamma-glutamate synthesis protein (capsule biosynthesis protein)